jgi:hypothetical protein
MKRVQQNVSTEWHKLTGLNLVDYITVLVDSVMPHQFIYAILVAMSPLTAFQECSQVFAA